MVPSLKRLLVRFDIPELKQFLPRLCPGITWQSLVEEVIHSKKKLTRASLAQVVEKKLEDVNSNIDQQLPVIELYDIMLHSMRIEWEAMMAVKSDTKHCTKSEIKLMLSRACEKFGYNAIIETELYNSACWIIILHTRRPAKGKKGAKAVHGPQKKSVFVYHPSEKYFFCSYNKEFLKVWREAFDCDDIRPCGLKGHNLDSLRKMLQQKESKAVCVNSINTDPRDVIPDVPDIHPCIKDRTNSSKRKAYTELCFGSDPPCLENFTIACQGNFAAGNIVPAMQETPFPMQVTFKAPNVVKYMKQLVEDGVLQEPMPRYMEQIMASGKNKITIKRSGLLNETTL